MTNFEVFKRQSVPITKEPMVTIQKRGNISLNQAALVALGEPESVELLFDKEERLIGFRSVDSATPHAYHVRRQSNSRSVLIAGRAFTQYFDIDTDVARRYSATVQGDILVVDLNGEHTVVTGPRDRGGTT